MPVSTFNAEFWRYYLKDNFEEFEGLSNHQQAIHNYENVFSEASTWDLTIDLVEGVCTDTDGNRHPISDLIAIKRDMAINECNQHLEIEYARWEEQQKAQEQHLKYVRFPDEFCWKKRTGSESFEEVTDFDIILNSVIEKFDIKLQEWQRYYEATLRYKRMGRIMSKQIKLNPSEVHSADDFSKAVYEKDVLLVKNLRRDDMREFWLQVYLHFKPRIVREYNHYGFIYFEQKKYFLADNVLIKFPDNPGKPLELLAKENGAFPIEDNKYVKPPEDAVHLPHFDLGVPQKGLYRKAMDKLLDDKTFEQQLGRVEEHFCKMVGGDGNFNQWGKLLIAYVFSYLFFEDIYDQFKHVIFLYLYGDGNVGKGEVAKLIQDFFGISHLDSLNTPPARTVDIALEQKSQIPQWIDEHVPEVPGKDAKIEDQIWNSWFELKPRQTNMPKKGSWGTERKEVRTMPLFCSNFKPKTDHLLSRSLILEYRKNRRGPEEHVQWLKREKQLLQLLMISFMQYYNLLDRKAFKWDLDRIRMKLKSEIKHELDQKNISALLQDRQLSQFAALVVVYHWLKKDYRTEIVRLAHESEKMADESDKTYREILQQQIEEDLSGLLDSELYDFVKHQIKRDAVAAAEHNPLTDYIETIGTLIQAGRITENHFNWTKEGHLKIWAKAVWDEYQSAKRGTNDMVRRETVEAKLKELSDINDDGTLKTVVWTPSGAMSPVRQKGFYIKNASKIELFRNAFNLDKYGPGLSQIADSELPEMDGDLPF